MKVISSAASKDGLHFLLYDYDSLELTYVQINNQNFINVFDNTLT